MLVKENHNKISKYTYNELKNKIESKDIDKEKFLELLKNKEINLIDGNNIFLDGYFGLICKTSVHLDSEEVRILKANYNNEKDRVDRWKELKNKK